MLRSCCILVCWLVADSCPSFAQPFRLPTANHALFEKGREEAFFVGTTEKPWTTGTFGCVRSEGWQLHEGLDIRCLERDRRGEPLDLVHATAEGTVVYFNKQPSLSNYGNYVILRHTIQGLEIYSLYAHLREVRADLRAGQHVTVGEVIGGMGRTSNTRERISRERAHVHFELNLLANERFSDWHQKNFPNQRNDHGAWNGQNLIGLDARLLLLAQQSQGTNFSLLHFLQDGPELCRVMVRAGDFPWLKRYPALVTRSGAPGQGPPAAYELALNYNGLPFKITPRSASELKSKTTKYQLISVNEEEYKKNPCRRIVHRRGNVFELGSHGIQLLDLLTY